MTIPIRPASDRRRAAQEKARALGVDEVFISELVETFYARIRMHPVLGPVFNDQIGDEWDRHLALLKDFWASVALHAARYHGKPVPAHKKVASIKEEHFALWLGLFEQTLSDLSGNDACTEYFMERANRIAESLKLALFGLPGLGPPKFAE